MKKTNGCVLLDVIFIWLHIKWQIKFPFCPCSSVDVENFGPLSSLHLFETYNYRLHCREIFYTQNTYVKLKFATLFLVIVLACLYFEVLPSSVMFRFFISSLCVISRPVCFHLCPISPTYILTCRLFRGKDPKSVTGQRCSQWWTVDIPRYINASSQLATRSPSSGWSATESRW